MALASPCTSAGAARARASTQRGASQRAVQGLHRRSHARLVPRAASAAPTTTVAPEQVWDSFAAAASGEWEGVTATFTPEGEPVPLPSYYVPEAYREWGVVLTDWQSQCSMRTEGGSLRAMHRRMMPTVGCEADAIAFTAEEATLLDAGAPGAALTADGSYSAGPLDIANPGLTSSAFQHCLALGDGRRRVRVVHQLQRMGADGGWRLAEVELHHERWDGPWTGKLELSGCGGGMEAFAQAACVDAGALAGAWAARGVRHRVPAAGGAPSSSGVTGKAWGLDRLPAAPVCLPLGVWTSAAVKGDGVALAVGVLGEDGRSMRVVSRRLTPGHGTEVELFALERG